MADGLTPPRPPVEGAPLVEPEVAIRIRDAQSREFTVEDIRTPDTRHLKHGKFRVTLSLDGQALFRLDGFDDPDDAIRKAKMIVKAIIGTVETRRPAAIVPPQDIPMHDRRGDTSMQIVDEVWPDAVPPLQQFAHRTHPDLHDPTKGPRFPRGAGS